MKYLQKLSMGPVSRKLNLKQHEMFNYTRMKFRNEMIIMMNDAAISLVPDPTREPV